MIGVRVSKMVDFCSFYMDEGKAENDLRPGADIVMKRSELIAVCAVRMLGFPNALE